MVAGTLLARYAQMNSVRFLVPIGLLQLVLGALVLIWTGRHYDELHAVLRSDATPVHPGAARLVGLGTAMFAGIAMVAATVVTLT